MDWYYADASRQQHPVPGEELSRFVAEGRIRRETLIWNETMDAWAEASAVRPDLFLATPPALTASERRSALQPGGAPFPGQRAPTDSVAVCSLVFGILGLPICLPILSIPAVICAHIARRRAREESLPSSNGGLALAGLILGYLGLACLVLFLAIYGAIFITALTAEGPGSGAP